MTVYNFSAGPAMLPKSVLLQAQEELLNWQNTGCSVMEMSHRSKEFIAVYEQAVQRLKTLMSIGDDYSVLFMHGGGRGQFSAVPLNLLKKQDSKGAQYFTTGLWSSDAVIEAQKYGDAQDNNPLVTKEGIISVRPFSEWGLDASRDYIHYCPNETVEGIEIFESPKSVSRDLTVVADMSSTILSRQIDINDYDVIYAGAQKNVGPSGLTIVIIKNALLERSGDDFPSILNYHLTAAKESMFNTPNTYAIYLANLVFGWLIEQGGVAAIEKINKQKADVIYQAIDESAIFYNNIDKQNRSRMNVTFFAKDNNKEMESMFLSQAKELGLVALKGHRSVGGIRASIYNAMPMEGAEALANFITQFSQQQAVR